MAPDARLIAFEMNERFVRHLARNFPDHGSRGTGSAENVQEELARLKLDGADYIISGIPFNHMRFEMREKYTRQIREVLNPRGRGAPCSVSTGIIPA